MRIERPGEIGPHKQSTRTVAKWLGHSPNIAAAHSRVTREHHFDDAVNVSLGKGRQGVAYSGAPEAQKAAQQASARHRSPLHAGGQNDVIPAGNAGSPGDHVIANVSRSGQRGARTPDPLGVNEVL